MKTHLLFFPCRNAVFNWYADDSSGVPSVTVDLLAQQRDYEMLPGHGDRRITCHSCCHPKARFIICRRRLNGRDLLFPRRFPGSARWHKPGCPSYSGELFPSSDSGPVTSVGPNGDFAALWRDVGDPEYRVVSMRRVSSDQNRARPAPHQASTRKMTMSLQRLARDLLQRSGVCSWRPQYKRSRDERVFNGLVKGALDEALSDPTTAAHPVLASLPGVNFVPWSFLDERAKLTPPAMTACVGYGFIESLGPENERGARLMQLSNYPGCPVLVPRLVLENESRNPASPIHTYLAHPTWVISVAVSYGGVWKIHAMVPIRVSSVGLIPVESHFENKMVARLVAERRAFTRWLIPPPECRGRKFIPDFQLNDTAEQEFLEVCGLMADENYAANVALKKRFFGPRLLVWDTRQPLHKFSLPEPVDSWAPRLVDWAKSAEKMGRAKVV